MAVLVGAVLFASFLTTAGAPTPAGAESAVGTITAFSGDGINSPNDIVLGPDGNLWFTNNGSLGRITPDGDVTIFDDPAILSPNSIAAGPDGNVWFTNSGSIGRITPEGVVTVFDDPQLGDPLHIAGSIGDTLYFAQLLNVGTITTAGVVSIIPIALCPQCQPPETGPFKPRDLAVGLDGVWYTDHIILEDHYPLIKGPNGWFDGPNIQDPVGITEGPLGRMWFADRSGWIGWITPTGTTGRFTASVGTLDGAIAAGPDGNLWYPSGGSIDRMTPAGVVTSYTRSGVTGSGLRQITAGPDGAMWFTSARNGGTIGRIQALPQYTARYSAEVCALLDSIVANHDLDSAAPIIEAGVEIYVWLAEQGAATPVVTPPANDGPCEVDVTWPADRAAELATTAAAFGVTTDQLHHLGGKLFLLILYLLAASGGA